MKDKAQTKHGYPGLLVVIEGTDGSGKTTQINMLKNWIEKQCYGVIVSEWKSSELIASVIDTAKERNLLNANTFSLMYASDFAHRLENVIIPALKSGFVVLLDRYTYTAFARDVVRGVKPKWVRKLYDFAPEPDLVFYLEQPVDVLLKRIIASKGLDYYESGRDIGLSTDFYESFKIYQSKILAEYDEMKEKHNFITLDGTQPIEAIQDKMKEEVSVLLSKGLLS
jgi:dTMP kinase